MVVEIEPVEVELLGQAGMDENLGPRESCPCVRLAIRELRPCFLLMAIIFLDCPGSGWRENLGSFGSFVHFLIELHRFRPLGYCAPLNGKNLEFPLTWKRDLKRCILTFYSFYKHYDRSLWATIITQ